MADVSGVLVTWAWVSDWGPQVLGALLNGLVAVGLVLWVSGRIEERVGKQLIEHQDLLERRRQEEAEEREKADRARRTVLPALQVALSDSNPRDAARGAECSMDHPDWPWLPISVQNAVHQLSEVSAQYDEHGKTMWAELGRRFPNSNDYAAWAYIAGMGDYEGAAIRPGDPQSVLEAVRVAESNGHRVGGTSLSGNVSHLPVFSELITSEDTLSKLRELISAHVQLANLRADSLAYARDVVRSFQRNV